jgi:hypothetical protein
MGLPKLVLFVEGEGDEVAVPHLIKSLITRLNAWEHMSLHKDPFRVGGVHGLTGKKQGEWIRYLKAAAKRPNFGGVLAVLDGDSDKVEQKEFCAAAVARSLAERSKDAGGGSFFSVACVFAMKE